MGLIHPAGRVTGLPLAGPNDLLPLQNGLAARAHGLQLVGRNNVSEDQITLVHELVSVYLHCDSPRCP